MLSQESKAARKNRKRRAEKKSSNAPLGFEIEEDVSMVTPQPMESAAPLSVKPLDPIADIKQQIEEAKAAKVLGIGCELLTVWVSCYP
jgi:hypothetical protein